MPEDGTLHSPEAWACQGPSTPTVAARLRSARTSSFHHWGVPTSPDHSTADSPRQASVRDSAPASGSTTVASSVRSVLSAPSGLPVNGPTDERMSASSSSFVVVVRPCGSVPLTATPFFSS